MRYKPTKGSIINFSRYLDIAFFLKFILLFLTFYFFHIFYLGITSPGGKFYSPFLDQHLNYISWLSGSILYISNIMDHTFGIQSYVESARQIKSANANIVMWLPCLGLGVTSFWIAFVIADSGHWQKKLYWCLAGVTAIWFINCWRIALLLLALERNWYQTSFIDHHTFFNILAYLIIFLMMYLYYKSGKKETTNNISEVIKTYSSIV